MLQISEKGKEMLVYQEQLAKDYGYKPIPISLFTGNVRDTFEESLPEWCKNEPNNIRLYTAGETLLCNGYTRIVIGDYGAFVEISPEQIEKGNLIIKPGQEYRINDPKYSGNVKYHWLTVDDGSDCKVYFQQKTVGYADYCPGMYYISPYEVFTEKELEQDIVKTDPSL